jgi:Immunity protein Imm1
LILNVMINRKWYYAEVWPEMALLIDEAIENLEAERNSPYYSPGDDARFMFSDRRHTGDADVPNNFLHVAVNSSTGFGALIWFVSDDHPIRGGIFDHVWVSNNLNPPNFDPRVVSDPGARFHDPRSCLPVSGVRAAVEEFCRMGTGNRPECICWVRGYMNGYRIP